jgi:metal-responsive CopG/Arc/MetJ family transcriptional regulator
MVIGHYRGNCHLKKERVIVYLYEDEVEMLDHVCRKTGDTRSELLRRLLRNYLEDLNLIRERVHS